MRARSQERGQNLVEYALILLLVALVLILIVTLFGDQVSALYSKIVESWP
jgi:pilus assembly protein Flp/PilA